MRFHDPQIAAIAEIAAHLNAVMQGDGSTGSTSSGSAGSGGVTGESLPQLEAAAANAANLANGTGTSSFLQGSAQGAGITEAPPSAAQSAYEYQTYVAGANITVGSQLAGLLGVPANSVSNGDTIMKAFEQLPYNELYQLEVWLYDAGYYNNVEGQAPTTRPTFGVLDINAFNAMSQAILQTQNSGVTLSQLIANNVAQGVGKTGIESQIQPLLGGGNAYQISLPNPDDIYQSAYTEFEQALGRAPTQTEVDALTKSLDAQTSAYQSSINQQQEQMSQVKYQAELTSRQKELNAAVLPAVPTQTAAAAPTTAAPGGGTTPGVSQVGARQAGTTGQNLPSAQTGNQEQVQKYLQSLNAQQQQVVQSPAVQEYLHTLSSQNQQVAQAASNPAVAAYFNALNEQKATGQFAAPGDVYTPSTTMTTTQAPTATGAAFTQATTGANTMPYLANQWINLADQLMNVMKTGGQPS